MVETLKNVEEYRTEDGEREPVCRNIFESRKYVEEYRTEDVERELGMDRQQLIQLGLLLGSDYSEGVAGVGIVNAIEIVHAFHPVGGLAAFRQWVLTPDAELVAAAQALHGTKPDAASGGAGVLTGLTSHVTVETSRPCLCLGGVHFCLASHLGGDVVCAMCVGMHTRLQRCTRSPVDLMHDSCVRSMEPPYLLCQQFQIPSAVFRFTPNLSASDSRYGRSLGSKKASFCPCSSCLRCFVTICLPGLLAC